MMPDGSYTIDSLLNFLKQSGMEGLINPAVARARRNAVEQLKVELTEEERKDVCKINADELASRFHKLEGSSIRAEALALYTERFCKGLTDFLSWMEDPAAFQSVGGERPRAIPRGQISPEKRVAERIALEATERNTSNIIPIPLRDSQTVYVANLPVDLSAEEAGRIARIVQAFANGQQDASGDEEP